MVAELDLFERLKSAAADEWRAYVHHPFVLQMGEGSLPPEAFKRYLIQDYLFLIQFARAWALAAYKSRRLDDIRKCNDTLASILSETELHIRLCARWGVSKIDLDAHEEHAATTAYTRFVLDCGAAGDLLDLMVALAPCVIGYAEIGRALAPSGADSLENHPYREWIGEYASDSYQNVAKGAKDHLNDLSRVSLTPQRFDDVLLIFAKATKLEENFWAMGLGENP